MAQRAILEYPDPRLRDCSTGVTVFDAALAVLVQDLKETLLAHQALGLSAPQLGDFRQVAVIHAGDRTEDPHVFINPEIIGKRGAFGFVQESCLSIPDVSGSVIRDTQIRVRAHAPDGRVFEQDLQGMEAVCLQHEMDHFKGRLFFDRFSFVRRWMIEAKFRARAKAVSESSQANAPVA